MTSNAARSEIDFLLSPRAVRERSAKLLEHALAGRTHFEVHLDRLPEVAKLVAEVTRANYPSLEIPFHSRWGHFQAAGVDRLAELSARESAAGIKPSGRERARTRFDLAIVSVLLDAGSGPSWKYVEKETGKTTARSEGLAVASFRMFLDGAFSSDPEKTPLRADARGLASITPEVIARGFQVGSSNSLAGLEGRAELLRKLGQAIENNPLLFAGQQLRPGNLVDALFSQSKGGALPAERILNAVLLGLGPIWPGRIQLQGVSLGDTWPHPLLGDDPLVPFHKLSQWLTYSLIEPLQDAGLRITHIDGLTGLAEYRNGGLLLDSGLVTLRDASLASQTHRHDSELVIEWRALTVALLDRIAAEVRKIFGKTPEQMPLARVLEGGTWHAGRKLAAEKRPGGGPPLQIQSDGTVF